MKVAIDVPVLPGVTGGVAVAVQSLLQGLGQLNDGDEDRSPLPMTVAILVIEEKLGGR